nr:adhesion G-protein coupled receptor G4 [Equus asinus]
MDSSEIAPWQVDDALSLKGKRLDFYGRTDTYVRLTNAIPELSRFTACIDLVFRDGKSRDWTAFSYVINNAFLGREDIDFGLAGDHQQLILHNLGKTFYIHYHLTPFQWHTICLIRDGVKGSLELFLNKERMLIMLDHPQNLTPNGTLVLGYFLKNGNTQIKSRMPGFTGSLYYFQLWDRILENEEFMKCLGGNVVSWEEDVWLVNKILPTVDRRLRCFVSENTTIEETSTTLSQQIDLTTPPQVTGLKPQKTVYSSSAMTQSMPVFATDHTTLSYSNTTPPLLETMTAPNFLKTSIAETATLAADALSTSAAIALPTKSTSRGTTTNSMEITKSPSSESTRTSKMAEAIVPEAFHRTTATHFLYTSGFTKNSTVSKTLATESQSASMKTISLFSSIESTSMPTSSWPKLKSTDIGDLPISTGSQEFLVSAAAGTVPWATMEQTSATTTHIGTTSAFPTESVLISTAAPVESVFPRNQTASTLATTDMEIAFTAHSMTLPTEPIETTPVLRTAEIELKSTNFQDVPSPRVKDTISTFMTKEASSMALSFRTSSPFSRAQSVQTVIDAETTHTALTPGITLEPTVTETMLSPTITGPVLTQNTSTGGGNMLPLISTRSTSTSKVSESGPTSITDEGAHLCSTNETTWTSRPDETLLTSVFHGSTSNTENSFTTANIIIPPEASAESEDATTTDAIITADATIDRYTMALSKLTSPWFANFSTVSGTTFVTKLPEFKLTTLLLKIPTMSTVAGNELLSAPREMVAPPVDTLSTLADTEPNFSTEESASETIQTETNGTIAFGVTTAPVPESATTQRFDATVTRKETTSHYLKGTSAITEVFPFATMLEATDPSAQMMIASITVSPFPDIGKLTTPLDNKAAATEVRGSWLSTKLVKTTPKSSRNGTTETFNSAHTYTANWNSETPSEGNPAPSPTSGSTQTFPEPSGSSTTRILGTSFATIPTDRTVMSLSAGTLPPQPTATRSPATTLPITHIFSLPVNVSAVTSMVVPEETKVTMPEPSTLVGASSTSMFSDVSTMSSATVTAASVPPLDQTASTTSDTVLTHRDSIHTTSEATVVSVRRTSMAVPSLTETPVPSLKPFTPVATKAETTLLSTSADTVTPSTPTLTCSKSLPDNIPVASSTHVISTMSTPVATRPISQVKKTSAHALGFPYTFSGSGDISLATGPTETSVVDETMPSHASANKLTTSADGHIAQSSTRLVNTQVPTLLVTDISTLSPDKEQMTTSLGNTPRTMEVTEMSPSKNPLISDSQSTPSSKMTDIGFTETTKIPSHQTHSPSEIPLATPPDRILASSPTSGSMQATRILTSGTTIDIHISDMSTSLGKTDLLSQALPTTTFLSPGEEGMSALSVYTPRTEKMIVRSTSVTHPFSYHQDTSFVDIITSRTTRISNPININTTLSHLLSPRTQPEVTSIGSTVSESTQTPPESPSLSTTGLSSANFTVTSTDEVTTALSAPNVPTALLRKTSTETSIPIYRMSSLPVSITALTSKRVSDTPTILMTKSSRATSRATSEPVSEISSLSVNDSAFSLSAVSSDPSIKVGSFSSLLSSITPKTIMTIQPSTLDATPVTYAGSASKSTMVSSAFTTSEMTEVSSRITPASLSSPTEPTFPSVKTVPTTIMAGIVTPFVGTTSSSLLSSKNTEAVFSIPKTTFSPLLSTPQQSSQGDEATTLGILSGITNGSLSPVSSGRVTALTNTYSRTAAPESVFLSTPSDNLHTSLNIQVSPSLTSFKSTPGPTKIVKGQRCDEYHGFGLTTFVSRYGTRTPEIVFSFSGFSLLIYLGEVPLGRVLASIYLPKSLREKISLSNLQTILFNFFGQTSLFKIKNVTKSLTTYVVSASLSDTSIQNLPDPVVITLQHIEGNQNYDQVHCAFWDFGSNNGRGGWNSSGCKVKETNVNHTICQCDHLTHFGVLMDLSRSAVDAVNERILVLITYIGCGISSIFLGVAVVTYIAFHKLRKDHPSKILINLCTALLMLNLVFLVNSWSSSFQKEGLCITAAVVLHYFLLVSLTWMGLEALHMYFALVQVFNVYIPNYILKFCLVGWGIPAIMVAVIVSVKRDLYGTQSSKTPFCWIKDDSIFYISVVAYFCFIFLMNLSMFCIVFAKLNSMKAHSQKTRQKMILHDLKGTTSLTFLLGLTWGFAFFAWGPVRIFFLYLFAIFNTLQGFLIFVFHCAMKESVREQWQIHLCCRWFRLSDSSDASRYGLNIGYKKERLKKTFKQKLLTPSLKSTATSSTFKSLGSAQGTPSQMSFPNDHFDDNPYCFSPLSCEIVPTCVRRI